MGWLHRGSWCKFCLTEGKYTLKWGKILPEAYWLYRLRSTYYTTIQGPSGPSNSCPDFELFPYSTAGCPKNSASLGFVLVLPWLLKPWLCLKKWIKFHWKTWIHILFFSTDPSMRYNREGRFLCLDMKIIVYKTKSKVFSLERLSKFCVKKNFKKDFGFEKILRLKKFSKKIWGLKKSF